MPFITVIRDFKLRDFGLPYSLLIIFPEYVNSKQINEIFTFLVLAATSQGAFSRWMIPKLEYFLTLSNLFQQMYVIMTEKSIFGGCVTLSVNIY